MADHIDLAIADLEKRLAGQEDECADTRRAINALCKAGGKPPRYAEVEKKSVKAAGGPLRKDKYYGKPLASVVREILEVSQSLDQGPLTVAQIYDRMNEGGYVWDGTNVDNRKRVLRISLAKNTAVFHKLPGGEYGLTEWYPAVRNKRTTVRSAATETDADDAEDEADEDGNGQVENEAVAAAGEPSSDTLPRRRPR